jgi:hypothetical protein
VALLDGPRPAHPGLPGLPMHDSFADTRRVEPARMFLCARCRTQVLVCSHCDRGQRYCPDECYALTRRRAQREAGNRYQHSLKGRHKHAQRMRLWRARSVVRVNKVTHQGSHPIGPGDVLAASPITEPTCTPNTSISSLLTPSAARTAALIAYRCRFCWVAVRFQLRPGFLRRRRDPEP